MCYSQIPKCKRQWNRCDLIVFIGLLNTTYLILNTTYSVNFNKQDSKRHLFKGKLEISYLPPASTK